MCEACRAAELRVAKLSGSCVIFLAVDVRTLFVLSILDLNVLLVAAQIILVATSWPGAEMDPRADKCYLVEQGSGRMMLSLRCEVGVQL